MARPRSSRPLVVAAAVGAFVAVLALVAVWSMRDPREAADRGRLAAESLPAAELRDDAQTSPDARRPPRRAAVALGVEGASGSTPATATAEPWATILVDVVDASGEPVPGVRVALVCLFNTWMWCDSVSDAEGRARLVLEEETVPELDERLGVVALGAFDLAHGVALDWPPPREPVRLVLPAHGALEVEVRDFDGSLVDGASVRVVSYARGDPAEFGGVAAEPGAAGELATSGRARFARVEAGVDHVVAAEHPIARASVMQRIVGPAAGETQRVVLTFEADEARYRATLSDVPSGSWSRSVVDLASAPREVSAFDLRPRDDGTIGLALARAGLPVDDRDVWLFVMQRVHPELFITMASLAGRTGPGQHHLGRLPPARGATFVAGRAQIDGRPIRTGLTILVRRASDDRWHAPHLFVSTNDDGAFRVQGSAPPGAGLEWAVRTPRGPIPFAPGERGLVVELSDAPRSFAIRGRVLADPRPLSGQSYAEGLRVIARRGDWVRRTSVGADGSFTVGLDRDEPVSIELRLDWHDGALVLLDDVRPAPATEASEPLVFDLSGRLRPIVVRGEDAHGAPLAIVARDVSSPVRRSLFAARPELMLLLDRPTVDLVVSARGWQDVRIDGVATDVTVRFEKAARRFELVWTDMPPVPLDVRLRPIVVARRAWSPEAWFAVDDLDGSCFGTAGRARVSTGAVEDLHVFLQIERRVGSSWNWGHVEPPIELDADAGLHGPVEVSWDPDEVARVMREMLER